MATKFKSRSEALAVINTASREGTAISAVLAAEAIAACNYLGYPLDAVFNGESLAAVQTQAGTIAKAGTTAKTDTTNMVAIPMATFGTRGLCSRVVYAIGEKVNGSLTFPDESSVNEALGATDKPVQALKDALRLTECGISMGYAYMPTEAALNEVKRYEKVRESVPAHVKTACTRLQIALDKDASR